MPKANWAKWEARVAEDFGGRVQPGSGNQWFAKGDVANKDWRISCKQTAARSFSVTANMMDEIEKICIREGKNWLIAVNMDEREMIVIDYQTFVEMLK